MPSSTPTARAALRTLASSSRKSIPSCSARPLTSILRADPREPARSGTARRGFFSLPDISKLAGFTSSDGKDDVSGIEVDGEVQRFHARKIMPYSQTQLYSLVADVPSYSSFIPFCTGSTVLLPLSTSSSSKTRQPDPEWKPTDQPFDVNAELRVGFGGLEERYISRVVGRPFESVTATASAESPLFKSLKTTWSFAPASPLSPHPSTPSPSSPSSPSANHPLSESVDPSRLPNSSLPTSPEQGPTLLTIDLAFSFANPLHRIASQAVLPKVADRMVEAFEGRCLEVWGKGTK